MDELTYLNFDLQITRSEAGYLARGRGSRSREATAEFRMPFSESEIEDFWRRIGLPRSRPGLAPQDDAAKLYGASLFEALFHGELRSCFRGSQEQANDGGEGLRILLRLAEVPELTNVPWEYLYDGSRFFALSWRTPVVRYLEQPKPLQLLTVRPPLKMLVMVASPRGFAPLDGEREWRRLNEALGGLEKKGLIELRRLRGATLSALQRELRRDEAHIFHFIGHGDFDERSQEGVVILEDESGEGDPVRAENLAVVLHDKAPRLVVLNACKGARASRLNPFSGVAQTLIREDVPAVVAMQTEVLDDFALTLAQEFYGALADRYPVDACLAEARKVLAGQQCAAWGTPVLYLRALDGRILGREMPGPGDRTGDRARTVYPGPPIPGPTAEGPAVIELDAVEEVGWGKASPGAGSWRKWAGAAALVLAVLLGVAYERFRESPVEESPATRPPEAEPQEETAADVAASRAAEDDRVAEGTETETVEPVTGRSEPGAERPDSEELLPSGGPGSGSRPVAPPEPRPTLPVASSWDRRQGQHRNERDGLYYVWIPEGSFRYGCSPGDDLCEDDEKPASDQKIEHGFWLSQTEVTVGAYKRFRAHASLLPPAPSFNAGWQDETQPIVNLSRSEAARFCEWAGARLPTEVEWEYAARAGEKRAWPRDLSKRAWFVEQSGGRAHAVSQKEPNKFDLFDMLGNVGEWVAPRPDQPADLGILRGGSWNHERQYLRFSFRLSISSSEQNEMFGFRCLADPS